MHKEILSAEQINLFPLLGRFGKEFGLVGGTAVALHLGHRRSIDFDLFTEKEFSNLIIEREVRTAVPIERIFVNRAGELTFVANGVKVTFFQYPFPIEFSSNLDGLIGIPDLLTLAAMKAFAIGKRAKWKDYVDLYFILKGHRSLQDIVAQARAIFQTEFNEKIFRTQLAYFDDINYDERVEYLPGFAVDEEDVKRELIRLSLG